MATKDQPSEPKIQHRRIEPEPTSSVEFGRSTPIFRVESVKSSIQYYLNQLGFQLAWDWGAPPTFACVSRGDVCLFLCEQDQGMPGTWLFVDVGDVDRLYDEYKAAGADVVQPPTDRPWGRREMIVGDRDGHRLRFASEPTGKVPGASPT